MSIHQTILSMKDICKSFSGVSVLKNVDFDLRKGEVHALMGENGAGKSTLMKILTGIYTKDSGSIVYENEIVDFKVPSEAQDAGIAIVHQELNMMYDLTVAQNIFLGREPQKGFIVDDAKMDRDASEYFSLLNIDINPKDTMGSLTVGRQQMCEIVKAISTDAKVIVFDEPTAALSNAEIDELFKIINQLREKGIGIIYISHRMDEIKRITDRVTVMRDGEYVGTLITDEATKDEIINMMVGRVIYEEPKKESTAPKGASVALRVENLTVGNTVKNVSFDVKQGEIVGFSGLMGAGRTETMRAIFGADKKDAGTISIYDKETNIHSPADAVESGICYLSEDRKRFGMIADMSIANNISLASLDHFMSGIKIDASKEREAGEKYIKKLKIKATSPNQELQKLSGGNQQKVIIAKWLEENGDIIIFDEPTRGIDVGAKAEIYDLMTQLAQQGKAIIMVSSELTEILRMSDRVIVMCEGKITAEMNISEASQQSIMTAATLRD